MFYIDESINTNKKYDLIKFLNFDQDNIDCHGSYMLLQIPKLPHIGEYTITKEQYRPDLLSYNIYKGETQYWWILMWYNALANISDLKYGVKIKYPSKSSIENLYIRCSTLKKVN